MTREGLDLSRLPSLDAVEAELRLRRLVDFIPAMSRQYEAPLHLAPLLRRFELALDGVPQRVCCSAPPRHGKTESVLHVPAFGLRRNPSLRFAYATYADRLSRSKSRKARLIAEAAGVRLESTALNEWRTKEGGGLLAGGVGGPLTGHGVDVLLVDDPVKNRLEAESSTFRERLMDWWRDVASTRIEPGGSAFVFMTRWHPDDLIGQLVAEGFEYINLPALTHDGEALWPARWPVAALEARRAEVGEYTWASLYQGQPRPRGGRVFGDATVHESPPLVAREAIGIDTAYAAKRSSDYSVAVVMARVGDVYSVIDVQRAQEPAPAFRRRLRRMHLARPAAPIRWYAAGVELGAAQFFRDGPEGVPVGAAPARGDKFQRAIAYAAAWNAGRVTVPRSAPWVSDFVAEHAGFTGVNDAHDDIIDAAVAAFDALAANASQAMPLLGETVETSPLRLASF